MKKFLLYIQNRQTEVSAVLLFLFSVGVVVYLNPREAKFKYEFQKGKPWMHENLVAPFDFNIYKTQEALEEEREKLRRNKTIFLTKKSSGVEKAEAHFMEEWDPSWEKAVRSERFAGSEFYDPANVQPLGDSLRDFGLDLLREVMTKGIVEANESAIFNEYGEVLLTENGLSKSVELDQFFKLREAGDYIQKQAEGQLPKPLANYLTARITPHLEHNITYDEETTRNYLQSQLSEILPTRGAVQKGELIIFKGNLVDQEKYLKLRSLKMIYEGSMSGDRSYYYLLGGQLLIMIILFLVLYLYLYQFQGLVMEDISRLTFILLNLLLMVVAARVVLDFGSRYIYLVPFAILPIVLRSFFDTRTALFVHVLGMLIIGFLVPNSFEFIFLQFVAGVFAVLLINNLYKRSQLFMTSAKIIVVYCLSYFSLAIIQEGSLSGIEYQNFGYFVGNGLLTLISFPLIYFQEKLFGFVSEVSLLELSDTNNPLLRELAQKAPGSFQHSLQVANLAEAAANAIKANPLLVRTGALYHDIGKMDSPMYFIENQSTGINPHDELSFEESAEIIIGHVTNGIKMAKRHNLPDVLIDFIRTHHGTTTVMFFYKQYIKNFPEDKEALLKFTYPGPKPFSKETAVLMMADTVEAASRAMSSPDHEKIDELIEKLIDHQIEMEQFENAPITLREIREVKKIFKKMLMNIYHVRVQYPE